MSRWMELCLCFVLLTLVLVWRQEQAVEPSVTWLVRCGILRDLVAELPAGRQALVCSPSFMPLAGVAALPFVPFVRPAGYGYAYLYGLALLLAVSALPLRSLLRRWVGGRLQWLASCLLAAAAAALGAGRHSDLLASLALLILAVFFETRDRVELRALAGVFWGLVLFSHVAGFVLAIARGVLWLARGCFGRRTPEEKAVCWIQGLSLVYVFAVYCFLNWMIMGSWLYPLRTGSVVVPNDSARRVSESLAAGLAGTCPNRVPIVSGHWGYVVHPFLSAVGGYHFVDFHPAKLPRLETRPLVLVVPAPGNPMARLCDWSPGDPARSADPVDYLRLGQTSDWLFYLVDSSVYSSDGRRRLR